MSMHNYKDKHGHLLPAVVYGHDGTPLLSWRVAILPFIDQEELYKQFRLDEPWDSPHNVQLLPRMPVVYAPPPGKADRVPAHHTVVHVFVGEGTAFEKEGLRICPEDFPDGTSNTLLVVEAGGPVPWTKPANLQFNPNGPLPNLKGLFHNGFRARMADCASHWVPATTSEQTLRALITRNGRDKPGPEWDAP